MDTTTEIIISKGFISFINIYMRYRLGIKSGNSLPKDTGTRGKLGDKKPLFKECTFLRLRKVVSMETRLSANIQAWRRNAACEL